MRLNRLILTALGLSLLMPLSVLPQPSRNRPAKFTGIVVDAYIARVPKASILIEGAGKKWNLETDEGGRQVGEINVELPTGEYKFTVEAPGFKRLVVTDFCIASGALITYEFRLEVRGCDDCELIAPSEPPVSVGAQPNNSMHPTPRLRGFQASSSRRRLNACARRG